MPSQDLANVRGDQLDVYIGDALAPFYASVSVGANLTLHPLRSARTGDTILGHTVDGHKCALSFVFFEMTVADGIRWNGLAGNPNATNPLPAVGTLMPTYPVRLHNPGDGADTSKDIYMPAVNFFGFSMSIDGKGTFDQTVPAEATRHPTTGILSQIGWVDPS